MARAGRRPGSTSASKWDLARSWLFTTDPARIGVLWIAATFLFFLAGGVNALVMRAELMAPGRTVMDAAAYNQQVTLHGTFMFFLFAVPVFVGFGSVLVPRMIGAENLAFPRLNLLDFWLILVGGLTLEVGYLLGQVPDAMYTAYTPLSTAFSPGLGQDWWIWAIMLESVGSLLAGINFVATILFHRQPGMRLTDLPLFAWSILIIAATFVLSLPFLMTGLAFMFLDRHFGTHFFAPDTYWGPLLWQDLYWFDSHPAVYIMAIPAFGIISTIIPRFARRRTPYYRPMVLAMAAVAFFGFFVWWHHMYVTGIPAALRYFAMAASMAVAVPSGFLVFTWLATLYKGRIRFDTPMLFALGAIAVFVLGGVSGVYTASIPLDVSLHGTYFVTAHIHYVIFGSTIFGFFAGFYYWFPHIFHRRLHEGLGKAHFWLFFAGTNLTFWTMHNLGLAGMPRRVWDYQAGLAGYNLLQTVGAYVIALAVALFLANVALTAWRGRPVADPDDPWRLRPGGGALPMGEGGAER